VKRSTGIDIRTKLGGKSAVEIAEERLRGDQQKFGGTGNYQGVQMPIHDESINQSRFKIEDNYSKPSHIGANKWGGGQEISSEPKVSGNTNNIFGGMET